MVIIPTTPGARQAPPVVQPTDRGQGMRHRRRRVLRVFPTRRCVCGQSHPCPDVGNDYISAPGPLPDGQGVRVRRFVPPEQAWKLHNDRGRWAA
jgi:hypothetical protein